jgi:hypothetical protein
LNALSYFQWAELKTYRCSRSIRDMVRLLDELAKKPGEKAEVPALHLYTMFPNKNFGEIHKTVTFWFSA